MKEEETLKDLSISSNECFFHSKLKKELDVGVADNIKKRYNAIFKNHLNNIEIKNEMFKSENFDLCFCYFFKNLINYKSKDYVFKRDAFLNEDFMRKFFRMQPDSNFFFLSNNGFFFNNIDLLETDEINEIKSLICFNTIEKILNILKLKLNYKREFNEDFKYWLMFACDIVYFDFKNFLNDETESMFYDFNNIEIEELKFSKSNFEIFIFDVEKEKKKFKKIRNK